MVHVRTTAACLRDLRLPLFFAVLLSAQTVAAQVQLTSRDEIEACFSQATTNRVTCEVAAVEIELSDTLKLPVLGTESEARLVCNGTRFVFTSDAPGLAVLEIDASTFSASQLHDWDFSVEGCDVDDEGNGAGTVGIKLSNPQAGNGGRVHLRRVHVGNSLSFNDEGDTALAAGETDLSPPSFSITDSAFESFGTVIDLPHPGARLQMTDSLITASGWYHAPSYSNPCLVAGGSVESTNNIWYFCDYIEVRSGAAAFRDQLWYFGIGSHTNPPSDPWFRIGDSDPASQTSVSIDASVRVDPAFIPSLAPQANQFFALGGFHSLNARLHFGSFSSEDPFDPGNSVGCPPLFGTEGMLVDSATDATEIGAIDVEYSVPKDLFTGSPCEPGTIVGQNLKDSILVNAATAFGRIHGGGRELTIGGGQVRTTVFTGYQKCVNLGQLALGDHRLLHTFENDASLLSYSCTTTQSPPPTADLTWASASEPITCGSSSGFQKFPDPLALPADETLQLSATGGAGAGETLLCFSYGVGF